MQSSPEVDFAHFLDSWRASWRYEPRWPSAEAPWAGDAPGFRVWLPFLHPARRRLGRAFYVRVGVPVLAAIRAPRDLPCYTAAPGGSGGFVFYDDRGRVAWRAETRAGA